MEIDEIYKNYCENGDQDLIKYIENIVNEKSMNGQWDRGIEGQSENLTTILLYEYATSIEKLTNGIITSKQVVDKLSNQMGKLRFGDFKDKNDDNVCYDKNSVTSDEYKKKCRIEKHFGAHAPQYTDENGKTRCAIVLFDNKQEFNGMTLSGIDLSDLTDIRHTAYFFAPQKLLRILERKRIGGVDFLHYISDVVNCSGKGVDLQQFFRDIDIICGELESDKPLEEVTTGDVVKNALSHDIIERARSSERLAEEDYR